MDAVTPPSPASQTSASPTSAPTGVGVNDRRGLPPALTRSGQPISEKQAWSALWALLVGFFMILVDSTIVTTAIPAIMQSLNTSVNGVIWVTSAYLLTYAVPLLVTGRLGDKFGPRNVFIWGLIVFTAASAWCGFAKSIEMLIVARAVQGLGAALMTPQSMAVITRLFPFERRGAAMGLWGSTAGVATLVGPILGGILVDSFGWEWIFFVNIPFGLFGIFQVWRSVPDLARVSHRFDWFGVLLSGIGVFLLVFGLQEGNTYNWGTITGIISVPLLLGLGAIFMVAFVVWEAKGPSEPLVPLRLFGTWNFSMGNMLTFCMGATVTSMTFPLMIFLQDIRYLTPTKAALCMVPNAIFSGALAPVVGKLMPRLNAKAVISTGLALFSLTLGAYYWLMRNGHPVWQMILLGVPMGIAMSLLWGPISLITTRDLGPRDAGAGSSVFNTTRQMGSVLGSALISLVMTRRIAHWINEFILTLPPVGRAQAASSASKSDGHAPAIIALYIGHGLAESMLLPTGITALGFLIALWVRTWKRSVASPPRHASLEEVADSSAVVTPRHAAS